MRLRSSPGSPDEAVVASGAGSPRSPIPVSQISTTLQGPACTGPAVRTPCSQPTLPGAFGPPRSFSGQRADPSKWRGSSPTGNPAQGDANTRQVAENVSRMPNDGVRTRVDDMVTTVGLEADARL